MANITIYVNGKPLLVDSQKMLIQALLSQGISVPHFCYHEALGVDGNCRMCMVEIEGEKRPQIACNTPIKEGMRVSTTSDAIMKVKRSILELELINHPVDCPICDQAGECSLQEYYMEVGLHESRIDIAHKVIKAKHIDLGANVILDQERCVLCARCTRFTANITQTYDLVIANRGNRACVTTFADTPLEAKGYAMNVVDLCPVGALTSKDFRFAQRVWFLTSDKSICHGCSKGCNIYIDHNQPKYEAPKIYRFRPRKNLSVNGHFICDEGRLSYKVLNENRLKTALHKKRPLKLESALRTLAKRFAKERESCILLISPSLSLESMLQLQYFATYHNIALFGYESASMDPDFADDMLKQSDRASNRRALALLKINEDPKALHAALESATLVLNFSNLDYISFPEPQGQSWIHFTTHTLPLTAMQIPIRAYSEQTGHLINTDGMIQKFTSRILPPEELPQTAEILAAIAGKNFLPASTDSLIKSYLPEFDHFREDLDGDGLPLERLR